MRKKFIINFSLVLLSVLISYGIVEILFRTVLYSQFFERNYPKFKFCKAPKALLKDSNLYKSHPKFGWTYYPGSQFFEKRSRFDEWNIHTYDRHGFRNKYNQNSGKYILFLGDSFVRGRLASDRETATYRLDQWLPNTGVKNFGVGGYTTINELVVYNYFSGRLPHDLVILGYFYLDVIENAQYSNKESSDGSSISQVHYFLKKFFYTQNFLEVAYFRIKRYVLKNDPFGFDFFSPFPTGKKRIEQLELTRKILNRLIKNIERNNAELLIVNIPALELIYPGGVSRSYRKEIKSFVVDQKRMLSEVAERTHVHILGLLKSFRSYGKSQRIYGHEDHHLNEKGQRLLAKEIYQWGIKHGYFLEAKVNFDKEYSKNYKPPLCPPKGERRY